MTKRILILKGSPREKGNSSVLAEQVSAGAQEAGALILCIVFVMSLIWIKDEKPTPDKFKIIQDNP